jgi:hypothetical protein
MNDDDQMSKKTRRSVLHYAKLESNSCRRMIVLCLQTGAIQDDRWREDICKVENLRETMGACNAWDTTWHMLHVLYPRKKWHNWHNVFRAAFRRLKHLPPWQSSRFYNRQIDELCRELESPSS